MSDQADHFVVNTLNDVVDRIHEHQRKCHKCAMHIYCAQYEMLYEKFCEYNEKFVEQHIDSFGDP